MTATEIQRPHTLTSIAADAKTTKRTVQRWLSKHEGELGVLDGDTRYFSDAERDMLLSYQSKRQTTDNISDEPVTLPTTPTEIQIHQGNHQQTLASMDLSGSRDLGLLRSPYMEVVSFDDPLSLAQQVIQQNNQLVGAMSTDLQQRQAQINQANQALSLVEQSNHNLMLQTQQYQIESRVQAAVLNQTTTQLQQKIAIQQSLGKPVGASSEQSQA